MQACHQHIKYCLNATVVDLPLIEVGTHSHNFEFFNHNLAGELAKATDRREVEFLKLLVVCRQILVPMTPNHHHDLNSLHCAQFVFKKTANGVEFLCWSNKAVCTS